MLAYASDAIYLISAVLFIIGIKMLSTPESAPRGNYISAVAMVLAVGITLLTGRLDFTWIAVAGGAGAVIGVLASRMVKMTAMPQMVAIYNGLGGAASALVAVSEYVRQPVGEIPPLLMVVILLSLFVGWLTLSGSLVAFGKLQELVTGSPVSFPLQHPLNLLLGLGALACAVVVVADPAQAGVFGVVIVIALLLGVLLGSVNLRVLLGLRVHQGLWGPLGHCCITGCARLAGSSMLGWQGVGPLALPPVFGR
jgi:NAD(P) transhydrogenase subunit beta